MQSGGTKTTSNGGHNMELKRKREKEFFKGDTYQYLIS